MDRTLYLQLCQKVSCCPNGVNNTKTNIPAELLVEYNGDSFYPQAYELAFINGKTVHRAILHSLKVNSIIYCDLEKVKKTNE